MRPVDRMSPADPTKGEYCNNGLELLAFEYHGRIRLGLGTALFVANRKRILQIFVHSSEAFVFWMNTHYICHDSKNFGVGAKFLPKENFRRGKVPTLTTFSGNVADFELFNRPCTLVFGWKGHSEVERKSGPLS